MERFPRLGLLSGTWVEQEVAEEKVPTWDLGKAVILYIVGLGTGLAYAHYKEWLKADPERKIIFLEEQGGVIASFLHKPQALDILADLQVELELFPRKKEEIEALAERFPVQRIEVVGLAPHPKRSLARFKLKLLRKTALTYALRLDRLQGNHLFSHFVQNLKQLPHSFYANRLKGTFSNVPAVVCGAGPSLQASLDVLRTLEQRALIFAGGSTLAALSSQGITPHFAMAIDPNFEEYRRLKNSFAFEVPFLYSTRVHPAIFQTCNGPFGYMRTGLGGAPELWMEEELGLLDPLIGDFLSPETGSVTSICIAWAQYLGCNPILLNGIDMAYTNEQRYSPGVLEEKEAPFQEIDREKSAADRILRRKNRAGTWVHTAVRWVMESASISHFAKKHPEITFWNTTEGGIGFRGIAYTPLEQAVQSFPERDLRNAVLQAIFASPMPSETQVVTQAKMEEMKESLQRVVAHLEVLAGEKKGSSALAEFEIQEEIAALYLFYDIHQIFKAPYWQAWLELARKYQKALL